MAYHAFGREPAGGEAGDQRIEHLAVGACELLLAPLVALLVLLGRVEGEGRPLDHVGGDDAGARGAGWAAACSTARWLLSLPSTPISRVSLMINSWPAAPRLRWRNAFAQSAPERGAKNTS